jgi:LacI family transcriptional regulator
MQRVTIRDVSREARTGVATVSKVLNPGPESGRISEACRKRVLEACEKLGYLPSQAGRSLRTGRSYTIGGLVAMGRSGNAPTTASLRFYAPVVSGMLHAAFRRGLQFTAISGSDGHEPLDTGLNLLRQRHIDGLVVSGAFPADWSRLSALMRDGGPAVLAGWPVPEDVPVRVDIDAVTPIAEAIDLLIGLGHRDIAWLGPATKGNPYAVRRSSGFAAFMQARGLPPRMEKVTPEPSRPGTIEQTIAALVPHLVPLLDQTTRPTAVIAYNEALGLALYEAARLRGLCIPHDLSVIAFDDIYAAAALPPMSVISIELFDVGARAVELCADIIDGKRAPTENGRHVDYVPGRLVVRNSQGPAPHGTKGRSA